MEKGKKKYLGRNRFLLNAIWVFFIDLILLLIFLFRNWCAIIKYSRIFFKMANTTIYARKRRERYDTILTWQIIKG